MLRNKDGMVAQRRLPSIVGGLRGSQPLLDECGGVFHHFRQTVLLQVREFLARQMEAATESGLAQRLKEFVEFAHGVMLADAS